MPNIQLSNSSLSLSQIGSELISNTVLKPYDTRISRDRPACFVFLIDQSGSMNGQWGANADKSKAELLFEYLN
jgi:uncharacterized protein with von Willebrand factor type A (vWA) domain